MSALQLFYASRQRLATHTGTDPPKAHRPRHHTLRCRAVAFRVIEQQTQQAHKYDQDVVSIGQAHTCDLRLKGANILDRHIQIERRGKQLYCRPAMRDPSNFLIDTLTWLDGQPLRQDVAYSAASGATISIGELQNEFSLEYEQPAGQKDVLMDQLIKSYARSYSKDEQTQLPEDIRRLL